MAWLCVRRAERVRPAAGRAVTPAQSSSRRVRRRTRGGGAAEGGRGAWPLPAASPHPTRTAVRAQLQLPGMEHLRFASVAIGRAACSNRVRRRSWRCRACAGARPELQPARGFRLHSPRSHGEDYPSIRVGCRRLTSSAATSLEGGERPTATRPSHPCAACAAVSRIGGAREALGRAATFRRARARSSRHVRPPTGPPTHPQAPTSGSPRSKPIPWDPDHPETPLDQTCFARRCVTCEPRMTRTSSPCCASSLMQLSPAPVEEAVHLEMSAGPDPRTTLRTSASFTSTST